MVCFPQFWWRCLKNSNSYKEAEQDVASIYAPGMILEHPDRTKVYA